MKTFKKGDRVIYKPEVLSGRLIPSESAIGAKATIVDPDLLLVQFDEPVGGHTGLDGSGIPKGCGWYVNAKDITKVRGRKKKADALEAAKEGLDELFSKLASLPEEEIQELFGRVTAKKAETEYFNFGEEYELNRLLCAKPLHIRIGLANDGFNHKEIGFGMDFTPILCKGLGDDIEEIELTSNHYIRFKVNR